MREELLPPFYRKKYRLTEPASVTQLVNNGAEVLIFSDSKTFMLFSVLPQMQRILFPLDSGLWAPLWVASILLGPSTMEMQKRES